MFAQPWTLEVKAIQSCEYHIVPRPCTVNEGNCMEYTNLILFCVYIKESAEKFSIKSDSYKTFECFKPYKLWNQKIITKHSNKLSYISY